MVQKTAPFIEAKYGWEYGESGWNTGMDENLLKFSYLLNSNIDAVVDTLPTVQNGKAYFLSSDKRVYFGVDNTYYSTPVPNWYQLKLKSSGQTYQFDGSSLVTVQSVKQLSDRVDNSLKTDGTLKDFSVSISSLSNQVINEISKSANNLASSDANKGVSLVYGAGRVLSSIAQLKNTPASDFGAFALGFYSPGDGGGGSYYWSSTSPYGGDVSGVSISATSGGFWNLIHDGAINMHQMGAKGNGSFDDSTAIETALNFCGSYAIKAKFGKGQYLISRSITFSGTSYIEGVGPESSEIICNSATAKMFYNGTSTTEYNSPQIQLSNIGIRAAVNNTSDGLLDIRFTGTSGGTAFSVYLNNIDISGSSGTITFNRAINLLNSRNITVDNIRILGDRDNSTTATAQGIRVQSDQDGVELFFSRLQIYFVGQAVAGSGNAEGIQFDRCAFVAVREGVNWSTTTLEPSFRWFGGHINASQRCIYLNNITEFDISHGLFYGQPGKFGSTSFVGIEAQNSTGDFINSRMTHNEIRGLVNYSKNGIAISDGTIKENILIDGNTFVSLDAAIYLSSTANGVIIGPTNSFVSCTNRVSSLSSDFISIPTVWAKSQVFTFSTAAATQTINLSLPSELYQVKPEVAICQGSEASLNIQARYEYQSSSATSLTFTLYRADNTNIPATSVRLSFLVASR